MDKRIKTLIITAATALILILAGAIIYGVLTAGSRAQIANEKRVVKLLPYETSEFKIEHSGKVPGGNYTISLYAILNGDSQLKQYNTDLRAYKQDAIKWLESEGLDTAKINIIWLPEEASKL